MLRGSYGPASLKDKSMAGYTPNVPWARLGGGVSPNGAGTSSSTPQVAAAAALWLSYYNREVTSRDAPENERWRRAEAVYHALTASAVKCKNPRYTARFIGVGMLHAADALKRQPHDFELTKQDEATVDLTWLTAFLPQWPWLRSKADISLRHEAFTMEADQVIFFSNRLRKMWDSGDRSERMARAVGRSRHASPALKQAINQRLLTKSN